MQYVIDIDINNKKIDVLVPCSKGAITQKQANNFFEVLKKSNWNIVPVQRLSLEQMKMIFALCRDYAEILGYDTNELREILKAEFCVHNCIEEFSCSPYKKNACTMEIATKFIQFIIEHAINLVGFPLKVVEGHGKNRVVRSSREVCPDIRSYEIACMRNKVCCVCGARIDNDIMIDLHHSPALGVPYEQDDGKQTGFMSLCRVHHSMAHNMGLKEFEKYYHLQPVWLTDNLIIELKKIYTNHFQNFHEEDKIVETVSK